MLCLNGLIERLQGTNTYLVTPDGQRVAILSSKIHNWLLRPARRRAPPAPVGLRHALHTIDRHIHAYIDETRLENAA